jgi:hypothetical protein
MEVKDNLLTPENEAKGETPEKFLDPQTGTVRVNAVIESYKELERKLATMMPRPHDEASKRKVCELMGCPEHPDQYQINVDHGLFTQDPEVNKAFHALGLSNEQAQKVYDLAAERLVPMIFEIAQDYQADREVERLIAAFGGAERWAEVSRQLYAYGQKNLPADVLSSLSSSFEGVMALHRMMKGEEQPLSIKSTTADTAGGDEASLRAMMRDPRYWRERDPHYVSQVTKGFQRIYQE